jgi:molybdopterin-guanine dinucleotide biosynthesis protein A
MRTGVILAGGTEEQINGIPKALQRLGDVTVVEHQVREMRKCCNEIIIVTNDPKPYLRTVDRDVRIITDYYDKSGPQVGMHAGFMLSTEQVLWIVGGNMPYISASAAERCFDALDDEMQAAVPCVNGELHPLHAVYHKSCAPFAKQSIEQGDTSAAGLLKHIAWKEVPDVTFIRDQISLRFVERINK